MTQGIAKKSLEVLEESLAEIINTATRRGQFNSADVAVVQITDTLGELTKKGEIDLETFLRKLAGLGYEKDLTKYTGKTTKMRLRVPEDL